MRLMLVAVLAFWATAAAAQAPLRVMLNADIRSTDPGVNRDLNSDTVVLHVLEGLVAYREDTTVGPMLAERVDVSADQLTYTFTLRDGVRFHNGAALTSAEVVQAWRRYMDPATQWRCLTDFDGRGAARIEDIAAPDARTVVFRIAKPSATFLQQMARLDCGSAGIFHRDSVGADGKWVKPVGTGPFRMGEWRRGQHVELERFGEYASRPEPRDGLTGGKQAQVERVRFVVIPDGSAAKAALFSGALDVRPDFSAQDVEEARKRPDVRVTASPTMELNGILFQARDPVFADARVRRAVSMALQRDDLVDTLTNGLAKPVNSPVPLASGYSGPVQREALPGGVAEARRLLAEAGYKGQPVKLTVTRRYMSLYNGAVFVQAMAKEAGFNFEVEVVEWANQLDRYLKGDYQAMVFSFSARLDPAQSFQMLTGPKAQQPQKVWDDAEAAALVDRALVEGERGTRQALFDDLQRRFVADMPMVPLWNSVDIAAVRAGVMGYQTWPASVPRLWGVRM